MSSKNIRITPLGVLQGEPKNGKVPTMYKPKDNKRYPLEYRLCTYTYVSKIYPYNSKKRGWVNNVKENT